MKLKSIRSMTRLRSSKGAETKVDRVRPVKEVTQMPCPRCKASMDEVVRIAPLQKRNERAGPSADAVRLRQMA
jgi:transposase